MTTRDKDVELIKALYEGMDFELTNRRLVLIGMEGIAVIFDDPDKASGLALVKTGKTDKLCNVNKINNQYQDENGQIFISLRGWVHSILRPVATATSSEYIPPKGEKSSI